MTTAEIIAIANEEGLVVGSADMSLEIRLRRKVIPKFEMDVGEAGWRRKQATLSFAIGEDYKDLPTDFAKMLDGPIFIVTSSGQRYPLQYIGEDVSAVALAEAGTESGTPTGYYIIRDGATPSLYKRFQLDRPTSEAFTLHYSYISTIYFADNTTAVELSSFIPPNLQWALVEGLRIEIFTGRLAIDDPRIMAAKEDYARYVDLAMEYREPGMRHATKRVKTGPL